MPKRLYIAIACMTLGITPNAFCVAGNRNPTNDQWQRDGREAVEQAVKLTPITTRAKNVILFVGDGMGISTVTAARILHGQQIGRTGEENVLSFEELPYTAFVKTYNTNQQVPDSAGTMTAMATGSKTKAGMISVDQHVARGDPNFSKEHKLKTIIEIAERSGLSTGVVTTTSVTHATPAACYAHSPERMWECDSFLSPEAKTAGFPDIARQLIEFPIGDGLEVVLGGGRSYFFPNTEKDAEYPERLGLRSDGRNLVKEWLTKSNSAYVWNLATFTTIDVKQTDHLLGLFEPSHMHFDHDRANDKGGEPSLSEMTSKAIDLLSKNSQGYFLMVEGGRIDHGHHFANAYRALSDTIEFASAVKKAREKTNRADSLIIVTADHSHVFTMGGYPTRGNPILGKVVENDLKGNRAQTLALDDLGLPYTTLNYANGPIAKTSLHPPREDTSHTADHQHPGARRNLMNVKTEAPDYIFEYPIPLISETHSGEDVPLYADGPFAHLFRGVIEQNIVFHVMVKALGLMDEQSATPTGGVE